MARFGLRSVVCDSAARDTEEPRGHVVSSAQFPSWSRVVWRFDFARPDAPQDDAVEELAISGKCCFLMGPVVVVRFVVVSSGLVSEGLNSK